MGESPLGGLAGDEAAFPVAFEAPVAFDAGPPEVNGKGGKLSGSEPDVLLESDPSRPGNVLPLPLLPLEGAPEDGGESDDGGADEDDPELSLPAAEPIDSVSVPDSRPGNVAKAYQSY
jgi:hypothetical protein